jgi:uncharacterized protein (DUF1501 family)
MSEDDKVKLNILMEENKLITLDTSLPENQQAGLNPNLLPIKQLYDEGKVNIIHGVSCPSPNYSHFRSTDLLFGAKDGTFQDNVTEGWFSAYLAAVYPGFTGQPATNFPHPWAYK